MLRGEPPQQDVDVTVGEYPTGISRVCALEGVRTDTADTHKVECKNESSYRSYKVEARIHTCLDIIYLNEQDETRAVGGFQRWLSDPDAPSCALLSAPQLYDIWENCENDPDRSREECIDLAYAAWTNGGAGTPEECGLCPAPVD